MARHRFHGDPARFDVVAAFVSERFPSARYVADVAGGQGMLARVFRKRYGIECDVVDPRGWALKGVSARQEEYTAEMADFYDVVVGLHPDEALRPVVDSAQARPVVVVPCCNFWDRSHKLGQSELLDTIGAHHRASGGGCQSVRLDFRGPKNLALVLTPPEVPTPAEVLPPAQGAVPPEVPTPAEVLPPAQGAVPPEVPTPAEVLPQPKTRPRSTSAAPTEEAPRPEDAGD